MDDLALNYQSDFNTILQMITDARRAGGADGFNGIYHV